MAHRGLCVFILSILDTGLNSLTVMLGRACPPAVVLAPLTRQPGPRMPSRPPGRPLEPGAPRGPVSILASSTRSGLGLQQRPTPLGVSGLVGDKYAGFERQGPPDAQRDSG